MIGCALHRDCRRRGRSRCGRCRWGGEVDGGRAQRPRHADAAVAVLNLDFAQVACVEKFGKLPDQIGIDLHGRSDELRGRKEGVRTCRSRWSPYRYKKSKQKLT